ncbi:butyrophilin subfamily 1 member A1-like isoform X2 [Larimichthys crocea]|uniref:butyrophilin subfamily 1 member A1-like isoform X2 n=1 Tax=Larimichthys crocea TaxID=215358 RepID=UPI000F5FAF45|nr:butyrophilin subfamily 1 member A1-like isoform X2 [Larimichthys crocea]
MSRHCTLKQASLFLNNLERTGTAERNHRFYVLVMYYYLFLVAVLHSSCTGESLMHDTPEKVLAFAGGDTILPCSFNITDTDDFPTLEWSKEGLQPNVVFLYRDGCEIHEMKNPAFEYRTSFINSELQNRNISLRISNVQLSDAGKYKCMRLWKNAPWDITTVELVVGAASEPKLSVVSAERGEVTLQCEANCSLLEPEITFLDDQGNNIPADDPGRHQDTSGCYTVTRRVTLQDATNSVTCRVHQPKINQTRNTEILIPVDCMRSCLLPTVITVGVTILLLLATCGSAVLVWKRCKKSARKQKLPLTRKLSDESTISGMSVNEPLLLSVRVDRADSDEDGNIERLTREVDDLRSKLREKEEIILQLQNSNSLLSPDLYQLGQPTMATDCNPPKSENLPQNKGPKPGIPQKNSNPGPDLPITRNHRIHSSPAILDFDVVSSSSSLPKKAKKKTDNMDSSISPMVTLNPGARVRRRHSLAHPLPALSNNPFTLLADLKEESEWS